MLTRVGALLVLLAALLQAAPAAPGAVSIRLPAAIVPVRAEHERQRECTARPNPAYPATPASTTPAGPPPRFPGYASPHYQRPPPFLT
ncbi:MAG: hypothetical protein HYX27_23610 [Acidobacteria bacterium]|nr:hypothetical protein [Acidobacteriota bacterium]